METEVILSGGLSAVVVALGIVWREWQIDRKKAEERHAKALIEQREDARAMHQLAADLGKASSAVAHINTNGSKIDSNTAVTKEILSLIKTMAGAK